MQEEPANLGTTLSRGARQPNAVSWVRRVVVGALVAFGLLWALAVYLGLSTSPAPLDRPPATLAPDTTWASLDRQTERLITARALVREIGQDGEVRWRATGPCEQAWLLLKAEGGGAAGQAAGMVQARCSELGHPLRR